MYNSIRKILYLGPSGSYTQIAMEDFKTKLKLNASAQDVSTVAKTIQMLDEMDDTIAILPIENSIEGIVRETVDNLIMTKNEIKIQAQITIPIQHCLISKGKKEDIENIISHPQALSQCQGYIATNFPPNINIISASSTSSATSNLDGKNETYASIANEFCAQLYGKNVIEKNINDIKDNQTRFVLLSKESMNLSIPIRTSIAFTTKNETGSLCKILEIFNEHNLNLVYIESRPSKKIFGEYTFFVDFDEGYEKVESALGEIHSKCDFYRLLGSYAML